MTLSAKNIEEAPRELVNKFKRKGYFDTTRKELLEKFTKKDTTTDNSKITKPSIFQNKKEKQTPSRPSQTPVGPSAYQKNKKYRPPPDLDAIDFPKKLSELLFKLVDIKVKKDPSILVKNKGKTIAIILTSLIKEQLNFEDAMKQKTLIKYGRAGLPGGPRPGPGGSYGRSGYHNSRTNGFNGGGKLPEDEAKVINEINKMLRLFCDGSIRLNSELNNGLVDTLKAIKQESEEKDKDA
ncbi:unnamed protein product [Ambrosiozyma monospora]|uniref:Unnamed protein product n=1 Tax=Ambrosiozyma monospora TaxID=43982 RepID=A0ACB5SZ13_AMBMO|nr:unnamed protein product [Ambrosiozyma monospora]